MSARILVVGPAWVGDTIMAQTLFSLLKHTRPNDTIDVTAPPATRALLYRMPEVDRAHLFDVGHGELRLGYRRGVARQLGDLGYDQAIVLPNSLKSALVPWLAGIPERTGFLGEYRYLLLNDIRMLDRAAQPRMVDRFMSLGLAAGAPLPEALPPQLKVDVENQQECLERFGLDIRVPILGLCPGAEYGDAKRWPPGHFAAVAAAAIDQGRDVWLFGSPGDQAAASEIMAELPRSARDRCRDLTGRTALLDAIDLLALCESVVSNDSGLMHMAAAVGCHIVVLYGSTSPDFTPPLTDRAEIESLGLDCSPCFKRACPLGHKNCLNELAPSGVIARLDLS